MTKRRRHAGTVTASRAGGPRCWLGVALAVWLLGGVAIASAQTVVQTAGLSFGAFVAGTGGAVVQDRQGGRSKTGGVLLVPQGPGAAARFTVTGDPMASYSITLPDTAVLSDSNQNTMVVSQFLSTPSTSGTLSGGGSQSFSVGASLAVGPAVAPGDYHGSFPVTVEYN